jgi:hypothetical protein
VIAAPTCATDQDAKDFSAARMVNTALSLRACADWIQSVSTLVWPSREVFGSGFSANGTCTTRRLGVSKPNASESASFWHSKDRSRSEESLGGNGMVNLRTPLWCLILLAPNDDR